MKTKIINKLKSKFWLPLLVAGLTLTANQASAQTVIAKWSFEGVNSALSYAPGANVVTTNFFADSGTQAGIAAITGKHFGFGTPTYSSPSGNGSLRSLSANGWTNNPSNLLLGDYYQIVANTTGFTNIQLSFAQLGSSTGPRNFTVAYSTDGTTFISNSVTAITSSTIWTVTTLDLSSITSLANKSAVYFRLIDNSTNSVGGAIVGTGGSSRIDDVQVAGTIAGPPQILTQPPNTTNFFGDTTSITVIAGGDAPLSYQWYTNSTPITPLADGSSGFGNATNGGTASATLVMAFLRTNQTGNYRVVITNPLGTITSSVVHLQVNIRAPIVTNIAYIRKLHDTNFVLIDTTNIYVVEGVVTTPINLVSGPTEVESFFMQDTNNGAGCDVFFRGGFPMPALGDHVRVTSPALQFNGLSEMAPVNGNPAHNVEILDNNYPIPAALFFDITTLPTPTNMEELIEGRYMVVSNVFFGIATNQTLFTAGGSVFMTNGLTKKFNGTVANNPVIDIVGTAPAFGFAKSIRGVMTQAQSSGTALTNGYSILIAGGTYIDQGTPVTANADTFTMFANTTGTNSPLLNDSVLSPDATPRTLTVTAVTTTNGTVTIDGNNTNILFTPDANYIGSATLGYTATDNFGFTANGTIVVTVQSAVVNPIPLNFTFTGGNSMTFNWTNATFSLQSSTNVAGPYSTIVGAASGFSTNTAAAQMFFRLYHP